MKLWITLLFCPLLLWGDAPMLGELIDEIDILMRELCPEEILEMDLNILSQGLDTEIDQWIQKEVSQLPKDQWILGVGAKAQSYLDHMGHLCFFSHHMPQDSFPEGDPNFTCSPTEFPLPDGIMHAIFAPQVLENVYKPSAVLREFSRLLCQGGNLYLVLPYHGTGTYYMGFTEAWIKERLKEVNLEVVEIVPVQGILKRLAVQNREILTYWDQIKGNYPRELRDNYRHIFDDILPRLLLSIDSKTPLGGEPSYYCLKATKN